MLAFNIVFFSDLGVYTCFRYTW